MTLRSSGTEFGDRAVAKEIYGLSSSGKISPRMGAWNSLRLFDPHRRLRLAFSAYGLRGNYGGGRLVVRLSER